MNTQQLYETNFNMFSCTKQKKTHTLYSNLICKLFEDTRNESAINNYIYTYYRYAYNKIICIRAHNLVFYTG